MTSEKMTISWTRWVSRPATQQDVDEEQADWDSKKDVDGNGPSWTPIKLGEQMELEETVELPGKYEVCGRCQGKGSHVNPNIDGHGITAEEWWGPDWDDESREMYMSGGYDVSCYECHGKRVVLVVDEERCDKALYDEYYSALEQRAHEDYCDRRTRWAEDGYRGSFDDY